MKKIIVWRHETKPQEHKESCSSSGGDESLSAAWWMTMCYLRDGLQPVSQSEVDTTFTKVALRSPSLIFLFSSERQVASAFAEEVFLGSSGEADFLELCSHSKVDSTSPQCAEVTLYSNLEVVLIHPVALLLFQWHWHFHWFHDPSMDVHICSAFTCGYHYH